MVKAMLKQISLIKMARMMEVVMERVAKEQITTDLIVIQVEKVVHQILNKE